MCNLLIYMTGINFATNLMICYAIKEPTETVYFATSCDNEKCARHGSTCWMSFYNFVIMYLYYIKGKKGATHQLVRRGRRSHAIVLELWLLIIHVYLISRVADFGFTCFRFH